ncbi:MAG TPA: OmpA family protein [Vineibacter sp.]|nr:OmpA family protein [Vineibacter sp.]
MLRVCAVPWRLVATAGVLAVSLASCPTQAEDPSAARIDMAQRPTRPGDVPPPAPPPPATQPRTGVTEPPQPTPPEAPKPPPPAATPSAPAAPTAAPRVTFEKNAAVLGNDARTVLDGVVATLQADATLRVLLKAYSSTGTSISEVRRLSLKRGVTVRDYLVAKGIQSTRIDLQPLGIKPLDGPQDYVELLVGGKP